MSDTALNALQPAGKTHQGIIQSTTVPVLFHKLWKKRADGVLTVTNGPISKLVQFEKGYVQFASSNDQDDRFNHVLLKAGVISIKNLMKVLEVALASKDRLGEVMVRWNLITAQETEKWVKVQVREIVHSVFNWTSGSYSFEEKPIRGNSFSLKVKGDVMVLEGLRKTTSWARVYKEVGGLNTEYMATNDMPDIISGLPLKDEEKQLIYMCQSPTSLGEMCDASSLLDLHVCKVVWALLIVGALMKA